MTNSDLWRAALGELELLISKANFTTWFRSTFISEVGEGRVIVGVPNAFTKAWLENKYHSFIVKALQRLTEGAVSAVSYRVEQGSAEQVVRVDAVDAPAAAADQASRPSGGVGAEVAPQGSGGLNPRYTFSRFIVGTSSELAHAACLAVAKEPGQAYNPLFLYGGVGLGKTHLLQAVGNAVVEKNPRAKVLFTNCERFTNDFINSIRSGQTDSFKRTYRDVDVLLIDDIQFIANKEQTQEEFFHTFNALHQENKQIVLTSDRPPKSIPAVESRLISRFEWGMIADVGKPDLETRIAILEARSQERQFPLSRDVISYIAEAMPVNVRELEGALNRLYAHYQLNKVIPSVELARSLLSSLQQPESGRSGITPKRVIQTVAVYFDISLEDLTGHSRRKELVGPRQVAMYLLRDECSSSFPAIGHELGGRDHTTAMHACEKIKRLLEQDSRLRVDLEQIKQRLGAS